ncbi:cellulose binding domain-containing protein [Streptomyces sp. NPDC086091]|uniref:cellulose binding domain-containing protein n=1 Tax=Streptomyces sp. NPDC086091 TaxID=3365751 RepID=UPI00380D1A2C
MFRPLLRGRRPGALRTALSALLLAAAGTLVAVPSPAAAAGPVYTGVGTHFVATGEKGGACGVPPAQIESTNFVALNVWDTPGYFGDGLPRPVPADRAAVRGAWDNGRNCGRWVRISLGDFCSVANGGQAGQGICRGGSWNPDRFNGATVDAVVTDSCGDDNEWCRSDRNHLDLSTSSLSRFTLDGNPVGDLDAQGAWNNRKITWEYIPAPNHSGDIKLGFGTDAKAYYAPLVVTNLPNGIHGVQYHDGSGWRSAPPVGGELGQRYEIGAQTPGGSTYRVRVVDASDQLLGGGREYSFSRPAGCDPCTPLYTPLGYTTSGGQQPPTAPDTTPPTAPGPLTATPTSGSTVALSWQPVTDDVRVAHYEVWRDGRLVTTTTATSYTDTGLAAGSTHRYRIFARDGAYNGSPGSDLVSVTTPADSGGNGGNGGNTGGNTGGNPGGGTGTGAGCSARLAFVDTWGNGFNAAVVVTNTGATRTAGWRLRWDWPSNQTVRHAWNGALTQSGRSVTVDSDGNANSVLAAHATTAEGKHPGLTVDGDVPATLPTVTCTTR